MIQFLISVTAIGIAYKIMEFSFQSKGPKLWNWLSRFFTILIFLISISTLSLYSLFATEEGVTKRIIAGFLSVAMLVYFIHILMQYKK